MHAVLSLRSGIRCLGKGSGAVVGPGQHAKVSLPSSSSHSAALRPRGVLGLSAASSAAAAAQAVARGAAGVASLQRSSTIARVSMPLGEASARVKEEVAREKLVCFSACHHVVPLPPGHRFPMLKYAATRDNLANDGSLSDKIDLRLGPIAHMRDLELAHDEAYIRRFETGHMTESEMRNVGFPYSKELVGRTFSSSGGTVEAMRLLFEEGRLMTANVAGGTHHAFRDRGEGFCVFNDIAVAAKVAIRDYELRSILVIDLDVHQGNGTAALLEDDPRVTTFDVFGDKNYPWKSRMKNTYDVALPDGTGDEEYMAMLRSWLPRLMEIHKPELVFFQAGVDALQGDSFGRLALTRGGLLQRNNLVYSTVLEAGVPTVICMGGGYTRPMDRSIECHTDVYRSAAYRLHAHVTSLNEMKA